MKKTILIILLLVITSCSTAPKAVLKSNPSFDKWVDGLKLKAISQGISEETVNSAFADVYFNEKIVKIDRSQPEVKKTFEQYLDQVVSQRRIKQGQEFYAENIDDLSKVGKEYGVPPEFITALLGVETNYGSYFGNHSIINSLTTLSYDKRRSAFFTKELMIALKIIDDGHIALEDMQGSWAGAMGQSQFMPSSFVGYAVDYNNDGRKDIWGTKLDVFASASNYLHSYKFNPKEKWGREVKLPKDFNEKLLGLKVKKTVQQWEKMGVKNKNGLALPTSSLEGSVIAPDGLGGPAYLVYDNFRVFLRWNRSLHFATSVGILADSIRDGS